MASAVASVGSPTLAVGTPNAAVAAPAAMPTGLLLDAIEKKLVLESTLDDVFEDMSEVIESNGTEAISVPDAIFMKLKAQPTGARTVTVPLLRPLQAALTVGAGTPIGNEETQRLKYAKFYYNEYSHAVPSTNYGVIKNDMDQLSVFEKIQPQLSKYMKEIRGQRIREASIRRFDNVVGDGVIATQGWNQNWFIPNTELDSMPVYSATPNTFTGNITTALDAAGGTDGSSANINTDYLDALAFYAPNVAKIDPIMIGGKPMYVVMIPSTQVALLTRNTPGQLGNIFVNQNRFTDNIMKYNGVVGVYKNLILVEDMRYAEAEVTGATAIELRYLFAGNNDLREKAVYNSSSAKNWDMGMLYGAGALCEWTVKDLHYETNVQDYNRNVGNGLFGESGISLVEYDTDSPGDTTRKNQGSIVLPFATPSFRS
jgi:hypothetical protein